RAVFVVGRLRPGHPRAVHEERRVVPEPRPQGAPGQLVHARTHAPKVLLRRTTQPLDLEGLPHRAVTPPPSFARRAPAVVPPLSFPRRSTPRCTTTRASIAHQLFSRSPHTLQRPPVASA